MKSTEKQRSGFGVMLGLIGMIKPLMGYMILALTMGTIGNLCATFITVFGAYGVIKAIATISGNVAFFKTWFTLSFKEVCIIMAFLSVVRAFLKYAEQACNHYIAFKLLARIRDMIFAALRRITPAKLEGKEKGNLISLITSDVELLEVFYAHTISPIAIAVLTSVIMACYIGQGSWLLGLIALIFYVLVGGIIPVLNGKMGEEKGSTYRKCMGWLNTIVLDNLRGIGEILQYNQEQSRKDKMELQTKELNHTQKVLKELESTQGAITNTIIMLGGAVMLTISSFLVMEGELSFLQALLATVAMMSSFGPTAALGSLSNNLHQTLACGNRVLNLLDEEPLVKDIKDGVSFKNGTLKAKDVVFAYPSNCKEKILNHYSATFEKGKITGIIGPSGCGKSTLLKLFMRFFEANRKTI